MTKDDVTIDSILNEIAKGARIDGFHAKDLIAYPNQSDRYMKPAKQALYELISSKAEWLKLDYEPNDPNSVKKDIQAVPLEAINQLFNPTESDEL